MFVALSLDDLVDSLFSILTQISADVGPNCTSKLLTATTVRAPLYQKVAKIKSSTSFHTKTMPSYGNTAVGAAGSSATSSLLFPDARSADKRLCSFCSPQKHTNMPKIRFLLRNEYKKLPFQSHKHFQDFSLLFTDRTRTFLN